jgi:hypothetical protein
MIPIAGVSRLGQMLFCRKFGKARKARRGDDLDPETGYALNIGLVYKQYRSQHGEREGERHEDPKRVPLCRVKSWPNLAPREGQGS